MQSLSHLRGWGSHLLRGEGRGREPLRRGWGEREERSGQARGAPFPREAGSEGHRPGRLRFCPPDQLPAMRGWGGGGEQDKNPNRRGPSSEPPASLAVTSTCRGGAQPPPFAPSRVAAKFSFQLSSAHSSQETPPATPIPPLYLTSSPHALTHPPTPH